MICKLLIANRGEIACRIIRTCREMGIATVAVYSDADARSQHVELADEAVHIGAAPATESYLSIEKMIAAAQRTGAHAIHPGYGFLAENAAFARAVIDAGLIFIGPPADVIEQLGSKIEAKRIAQSVGVPVVPGYDGDDQSDERMTAEAARSGYPIMVKASAGGGGKGMREVTAADDLPTALAAARREAKAAFGDDTLLLEKRIINPRHVEIQIFGDTHGNVIALGERECSIQRRHQKIIEETPSPALDHDLRQRMCDAAVALGKAVGYVNAGTVEFILDADRQFCFLEVNTRLQVEHPVTEMVFQLDLVKLQIEVAEGASLADVRWHPQGHAIEVRVYAEDVSSGFLPSIGRLLSWNWVSARNTPNQSRFWSRNNVIVDSGVRSQDEITQHYDPMIAKIIAFGETRLGAIRRLDYALSRARLLGVKNNIAFLRRILRHEAFVAGDTDTGFLDRYPALLAEVPVPTIAWMAAAMAKTLDDMPDAAAANFRNNAYRPTRHTFALDDVRQTVEITEQTAAGRTEEMRAFTIQMGDVSHKVEVDAYEGRIINFISDGHRQSITVAQGENNLWWVGVADGTFTLHWIDPLPVGAGVVAGEGSLRAPMPGNVIAVHVTVGKPVAAGDVLLVMEAMKMEHRIKAPHAGIVMAVHYAVGQFAQFGAVLLEIST
ncbi:MAG: biotin carboxylase N-terminal domain-containing protein [Chloroflexota bacterium]|nr:biotin carboxylase N-terminal domain-containing protein [Chloroflexota bacterium]